MDTISKGIGAGMPPQREARGGIPPLPCLGSNISTGTPDNHASRKADNTSSVPVAKSAYKTEHALKENIRIAVERWGIGHLAFFTPTFVKPVYSAKLAQARMNSLLTHVIRPRYGNRYLAVFERHESGAIHFHFVVYVKKDIRTGFDWSKADAAYQAQKNRDFVAARNFWSAAAAGAVNGDFLREEWKFWREVRKRYRWLGRCEMLPIRSTAEAVAKYTGGYIAKHMQHRREEDKGVNLVRYGNEMHWVNSRIAFVSPKARLWREKLKMFAFQNGCGSMEALKRKFGIRWAFHCAAAIQSMPLLIRVGEIVLDACRGGDKAALMLWDSFPRAGGRYVPPELLRYLPPMRQAQEEWKKGVVSMVRKVFGPSAKAV